MTVLLVDDSRSQSARIQDRLAAYGICVVWRPSYRGVAELLRDPGAGQLVDLVLIDQAFETTPEADLLTRSEVDALADTEDWDVQLHQGLFIVARLSQDMREGQIPATPMMILTHYAKVEIAAQVGLAGYESKRRLLSDPYASLKGCLPQLRPTELDVDRRLRRLAADVGLDGDLVDQVRQRILGGLDLDEVCAALRRLAGTSMWQSVGRAPEQLADERLAFPVERRPARSSLPIVAGRARAGDRVMNDPLWSRDRGVLVELDGNAPITWLGDVVRAADAGPLCTQRPDRLTIWAPGASWSHAFRLLAMCKSACPEECLVLTDEPPSLELVPSDTWIAVVTSIHREPARRGCAPYTCADLRSDLIFRLLLSGRVRRRPELRRLLDRHALIATPHGSRLLERWGERVIPVLFASGLEGMMPEDLRTALEELADAARDAEHAVTGGFHVLDPVVRDPADWEEGARRYLPLAASRSPDALAAVRRWLDATAGWEWAPAQLQEEHRVTAAAALHRLADDPWLPGHLVAGMLLIGVAAWA